MDSTTDAPDHAGPLPEQVPTTLRRARLAGVGGDGAKALHCSVFRNGQPAETPNDLGHISEILTEGDAFVWLDVVDPGPNDLALLQHEFKLHPLAIEDAASAHERPKIEAYEHYWFVVVHALTTNGTDLVFHELAIFAGEKYLVTVRDDPPYPLAEIERRWLAQAQELRRDSGFLLYTILDTIVDGYFPVAEQFSDRVDAMEDTLVRGRPFENAVLMEIFTMKRDVQRFRRAVLPVRDILNPIIRGDLTLFAPQELAYYRDVYDHAVRVIDETDTTRDLVNSVLDIHLSVVANRQNDVNKQLTIIATIFLPLSFLTGFFGQNFSFLVNHITGTGAFWWLGIGSQIVVLIALLLYFKRKRWF